MRSCPDARRTAPTPAAAAAHAESAARFITASTWRTSLAGPFRHPDGLQASLEDGRGGTSRPEPPSTACLAHACGSPVPWSGASLAAVDRGEGPPAQELLGKESLEGLEGRTGRDGVHFMKRQARPRERPGGIKFDLGHVVDAPNFGSGGARTGRASAAERLRMGMAITLRGHGELPGPAQDANCQQRCLAFELDKEFLTFLTRAKGDTSGAGLAAVRGAGTSQPRGRSNRRL